jgi:hypothetical protein
MSCNNRRVICRRRGCPGYPSALPAHTVLKSTHRTEWSCVQALGLQRTAARAREVSPSVAHDQAAASRVERGTIPPVHERPPMSETYQVLKDCLQLWPALFTGPSLEETSSEDAKQRGDDKYRNGDFVGATSWYSRAIASAPCMLDVARSCAQLSRCSLRYSGYHTGLSAAAAAVWIVLPAAQLHARFEKPLGVFVRLLFHSLFALGFTADGESASTSPSTCDRWSLDLLVTSMRNSVAPCFANIRVSTGDLASRVRSLFNVHPVILLLMRLVYLKDMCRQGPPCNNALPFIAGKQRLLSCGIGAEVNCTVIIWFRSLP